MHEPYETRLKHKADFIVKYRFRAKEEGVRTHIPFQGIRCDFSYADENDKIQYIVWPEFLDENGNVILNNDHPVNSEGMALMWVMIPERRIIHKEKIGIGTKCYFREGAMYTADCEVVEILDLFKNPTTSK